MSANAYKIIDEVVFLPADTIVEVGSERGGGSTEYLRRTAKEQGIPFYSVDIDPQINGVIRSSGEAWLKTFKKPIGFAYLDNYDYIFDSIRDKEWVKKQREDYKRLGIMLSNSDSEKAHLDQSKLVHMLSRVGTIIVIDDTWLERGKWAGKGARAVPYLLDNDYSIIATGGREYKGYVALRRDV